MSAWYWFTAFSSLSTCFTFIVKDVEVEWSMSWLYRSDGEQKRKDQQWEAGEEVGEGEEEDRSEKETEANGESAARVQVGCFCSVIVHLRTTYPNKFIFRKLYYDKFCILRMA